MKIKFFWGRKDEDRRRQENVKLEFLLLKTAFLKYMSAYTSEKISSFTFWCFVIPLGSHSVYT